MNNNLIKGLLDGWEYTVSQRYELLTSLKDKDLRFIPKGSDKFKNLQYQFNCIGSTEKAYTKMLKTNCKFSAKYFSVYKSEFQKIRKVKQLKNCLERIDNNFENVILKLSDDDIFDWGDAKTNVWSVITNLQEHERLHHGQLISYFTLANISFPANFKKVWAL